MGNLQSSPSSSTTTLQETYDVFLSFRGEDTRDGFTNNLYEALLGKKIKTFVDDQLTRGYKILQALLRAIEESKISVVIFSKNYASSKWCLRELVEIMEHKNMNKQTVIPVFYGVDPSDVRNQTGSFKDSFVKHEKKFPDEVQKWREALNDASHLSGWNSFVTRPDTKLVNAIVGDIYEKLMGDNMLLSPSDFKGLIGLDERIKKIKSLLCLHKTDVRIIGIWGMGGVGKTTLAEVVFNQILGHQFEGVCFIENVREKLENSGGLDRLQKDILSKVLNDKNLELDGSSIISPMIKKRLNKTKVFIVLDDVDNFLPLEPLVRRIDGLGQGSRIIVTSRDKQLLRNCGVDDSNIYAVKEFNHHKALQLFCNYAFEQNHPTKDLKIASNDIVNYARGNPLALKVLGSSLKQRSKKDWESAVNKLRTNVDREILDVLRISYNGLNVGEQEVFLDIACFLKGKKRDYIATILDDCECSLSVLIDKSLITVSYWGTIEMHDLLQDLGRDIVLKESPRKPGERSRLWRQEDVQDTLKHGDGTNAVQGIFLDMFKINDMQLSLEAFNKMYNLRLLKFYDSNTWNTRSINKVQFREGLNNAPFDKLRSFIWFGYPLPTLSSNFNLENLVELDLSYSINLERLWEDTEHAPKLKRLALHGCLRLIEVPDLSKSTFLKKIDLGGCSHLTKIQNLSNLALLEVIDLDGCSCLTEIPDLKGSPLLKYMVLDGCRSLLDFPLLAPRVSCLRNLNLRGCESLRSFPSTIVLHYEYRESLDLSVCINLTTFPQISGNITELDLRGTAIDEVPPSIENLIELSHLNLSECTRLKHISTNICKLKSLKELNLENCSQLENFPEILEKMEGLKNLILSGTAIKELPHSIENLVKLYDLNLSECTRLKHISTNICKLKSLVKLNLENCSQLESFPEILDKMECLETLILSGTAIKELPHSIENLVELYVLNLSECTRLKHISTNICKLKSLMQLNLENCSQLESFPEILDKMEGLEILILSGTAIKELPHSIENLNELSKLYLRRCKKLEKLPCSLCNLISLKYLDISDCSKLKILPDNFGNLKSLEDLSMDIIAISQLLSTMMYLNMTVRISCRGCRDLRLTDLLGLPCSLTSLDFNDCNLKKIPEDIGCLSSLVFLELRRNNFESLPKSMKQLYKLQSLKVDNCNMLQSLTDLPSALKYLTASGCKQLRSIPDASEFANLVDAKFVFTNCLSLKETAVSNMLATLKKGYEEGGEIGRLTFFCLGSKVPEWFLYRTEGSSIVECCKLKFQIPLHDGSNGQPLLGFVVCAVIAFEKYCHIKGDLKRLSINYKYRCSDAYSDSGSYIEFDFGNKTLIDSDHIAFEFFKTSVPCISEIDFSKFSFEFWLLSNEKNPNCRIKSFGVCPIYAKHNITRPSFKKQKTIMSWTP